MANDIYQRNLQWAKQSPYGYLTKLKPNEESLFLQWVMDNKIPFDPSPTADYDMRGFWKNLMLEGGDKAETGMNANDRQLHFSDYFKTPYHHSFSRESKWATEHAPIWNEQDQLVLPDGTVVFDEREQAAIRRMKEMMNIFEDTTQ